MKSPSYAIPKLSFAEGLELCKKNGEKLLEEAVQAFKRKNFRCAFILGFAAWEEFGKAVLILENWKEDFIGKDDWEKKFLRHSLKIRKAKYVSDKNLLRQLGYVQKDVEIRLDEEYLKKSLKMKTKCLYVDFDFERKVWKSPIEIYDNLHNWAVEIIVAADSSKKALAKKKLSKTI